MVLYSGCFDAVFKAKVTPGTINNDKARPPVLEMLVQDLEYEDPNPINNGGQKNSFRGIVPVCIYIDRKKYRISQQRQGADRSNSFVVCDKETKKLRESKGPVTDKINNSKTDNRTQQTK